MYDIVEALVGTPGTASALFAVASLGVLGAIARRRKLAALSKRNNPFKILSSSQQWGRRTDTGLPPEAYQTFFSEDISGVFISSPDGRLLECNPRFAQILGFRSVEETLATNAYSLYETPEERNHYLQLLRAKRELHNYERTLIRRDGKRIYVVEDVIGDFDEFDELTHIRGYLFDVTERREAEERYRLLFEESKDVIFVSTPEGRFLEVNPAALELFGYETEEEMLALDIVTDMYWNAHDRDRFEMLIQRAGFVKDFEIDLKNKQGEKLTVLETTTIVKDDSGKPIAYRGIMRDITRQKRIEEELRQAHKMESIGTLAGGIAHDFNNIMGIMLGNVAMLERFRYDNAKFDQVVESLTKALNRGSGLVRQMLTFARKTDVQLETLNLNSAVKDVVGLIEEAFPKTVTVSLRLNEELPSIVADPNQLHQVLLNLCVNARDAMLDSSSAFGHSINEQSGIGVLTLETDCVAGEDLRRTIHDAIADRYVRISVQDSGCGMDEETKARIFEPFFTTKEKGKGTGLGLSVVYGVVKNHQGFITVESSVGKGTAFHLYFPVSTMIHKEEREMTRDTKETPGGTETILVVEDEEMLLELVKSILEDKGYKVLTARDGVQAIEIYKQYADEISLVLSDMGLPKMGGWESFRKMKEINTDIKAILASGYLDPNVRLEMLRAGAKDFVQKPYDVRQVLKRIREVLDTERPSAA